ncbi:hypothetical protein T310_8618, partial [Rasamsonia emersonii CBS 393.64]
DDSDRCIPEPLRMRYRSLFTSFFYYWPDKTPGTRHEGILDDYSVFTRQKEREQVTPSSGQVEQNGTTTHASCLSADEAGLGITGSPCGRPIHRRLARWAASITQKQESHH